jgi:hypothetical protein
VRRLHALLRLLPMQDGEKSAYPPERVEAIAGELVAA